MTKTVKDDTKQCTLSFSGGVLSPSARTLNDNKQQRITHLFSQNRPDPVAQSGEGGREGGGKQRGKKSGGGAKEDAAVKEEELKEEEVPEAKEVAVKEEEVRKKEMPTDAKTDAVKEEEITGEKEDKVREKEMPSDGKEDAAKEDEVKVQEVPSDEFPPCSGTEQLYCGVDENKIVPTLQIERKRKRLKQADSSEDEESGKSTSEIRGGDGDDDSAQSQKEEAVDPMDWRERIKGFVRNMPQKLVVQVLGLPVFRRVRCLNSKVDWDPEAEGLTEATMRELQELQYRVFVNSNFCSDL